MSKSTVFSVPYLVMIICVTYFRYITSDRWWRSRLIPCSSHHLGIVSKKVFQQFNS